MPLKVKGRKVTPTEGCEMEYLTRVPLTLPHDRVLVHNHVRPSRRLDQHGFRAWLQPMEKRLEVCPCNWAAELGPHYRVAVLSNGLRRPE